MYNLPSCPACGGALGTPAPYPGAQAHAAALRFDGIASCATCGLGMALPRYPQAALDAFYSGGAYWNDAVGHSTAQSFHERNQSRHRVLEVMQALPGGSEPRVLDVGAGHGWTADFLERSFPGRTRAFDFIEPDERLSRGILARPSSFIKRRLSALHAAEPGYDVIFLNHVLEHVAEPLECVREVCALLSENGIAYFETPHADQRFKADVFPHTWFFTAEALAQLGRRAGLHERLRVSFGRIPARTGVDLLWRAAYRASSAAGLADLAARFDDLVWRYEPAPDGIWLRWMVSRAQTLRPASRAE